jgi:hypothetical protein
MLKHPLPGGVVGPLIAINIKAFINDAQVLVPTQSNAGWDILVRGGDRFVINSVSPARVALLTAARMNLQPDGVRSFKLTPVEVFSSAPDGPKGGLVPWQLERKDN